MSEHQYESYMIDPAEYYFPCDPSSTVTVGQWVAPVPFGCTDPNCGCSPNNAPDVLDRAGDAVRRSGYKEPSEAYAMCATAWTGVMRAKGYEGPPLSAKDVCLLMAVFKISRELTSPKVDNLVDIAGYAWCAERCDKVPFNG